MFTNYTYIWQYWVSKQHFVPNYMFASVDSDQPIHPRSLDRVSAQSGQSLFCLHESDFQLSISLSIHSWTHCCFSDLNLKKNNLHVRGQYAFYLYINSCIHTIRGSSIGSEFAWHASGPEFDPHVRHILSWRLGHENVSTAILPLPLIQEEQLSVTGERMCTKYW